MYEYLQGYRIPSSMSIYSMIITIVITHQVGDTIELLRYEYLA